MNRSMKPLPNTFERNESSPFLPENTDPWKISITEVAGHQFVESRDGRRYEICSNQHWVRNGTCRFCK